MSTNSRMFIRLSTGEDIITEIVSRAKTGYNIVNPHKLMYMMGDKPGSMYITLMQWVYPRISDKQEYFIHDKDIITTAPLGKEMEKYYTDTIEDFSSNVSVSVTNVDPQSIGIKNIVKNLLKDIEEGRGVPYDPEEDSPVIKKNPPRKLN